MYAVNNASVSKSQLNLEMTVTSPTADKLRAYFIRVYSHCTHIKYTFSLIPGYFTICNTIVKVVGALMLSDQDALFVTTADYIFLGSLKSGTSSFSFHLQLCTFCQSYYDWTFSLISTSSSFRAIRNFITNLNFTLSPLVNATVRGVFTEKNVSENFAKNRSAVR